MAQFLKAKFLSQALEWKTRFPNTQFYGGMRFEPFIYEQARKIFPSYSKLYPDNKEFTEKFVKDLRNKDAQLLKTINPEQITAEIEAANTQFESEARVEQQTVAAAEEKSTMVSQTEQAQKPRFQVPKIPSGISSFGQNLGSSTQIGLKKGLGRVGGGLGSIFGSVARGGGGVLVKAGGFGADALARASNQISRGGLITGPSKKTGLKIGLAVLGTFLLIGGIASLGALQGTTPSGEAAPIPGNVGIAASSPNDISSCEFIHQSRIYKVGSNNLRLLISEVAAKTAVPASALTAIALQETANFTVQATDSHPAFSETNFSQAGCDPHFPTSATGALGLMQVQPPSNISTHGTNYDPKAADLDGIKIGLSFLGRDLTSLTKTDFCNVRTSLYLGAGVIISKNGGKPPTTADEVRTVACKYHGTCHAGGYSYADEVKQGFESCKAVPPAAIATTSNCPVPSGKVLCGSQFTPINGCGHCGVGYGPVQHCSYEGTKYGLDITGGSSQQISLPNVSGAVVQWGWKRQDADSTQAIQIYIGTEVNSSKQYYLQLHHTQPGSGKGGISGEVGGAICASGCDHVHVQIGSGGDNVATTKWLDAAQYFCRQ